jgi:hypothetical protein
MTALVVPFTRDPLPASKPAPLVALSVGVQTAEEAQLSAQLLMACAPGKPDRLEATACILKREGGACVPIVGVDDRGLVVIASADVMRRIAVTIDAAGRKGAALDLLQAADQAEHLAALFQQSLH